ncbi:hypothetical protein VSU19_22055 [Verrucomicrobiales bacterium BCK34]|nr:hypothetical protein [Verrucomicrobiales bacterium BCK34]
MKKSNITLKSFAALATALTFGVCSPALQADEKDHKHEEHEGHDHDHEHAEAGPNGGKVLHEVEPHLEFFVTEDRKVQITALGEDGKAVPIGEQTVRITGGSRSNPTRMTLAKSGDVLISDVAFPEGNDFPVVVQIKPAADAKAVIEKFNLNLNDCPTCDYKEYACTCDHGDHEGHDHEKDDHKDHDHKKGE